MLKHRILSTLRFFDLQDMPLTLLELHQYLISDYQDLKNKLDDNWDLGKVDINAAETNQEVKIDELLKCLETESLGEVENLHGFYYLSGRKQIVTLRQENYLYGIARERLIRRYTRGLRHLPFLRGIAVSGSQAFGQQKNTSDIDLVVITDPEYLWLGRLFITAYFQILGLRRHGKKIANRFCLNHYLGGVKALFNHRDLYNAMEYLRFRSLFGQGYFSEFFEKNADWLKQYFPNFQSLEYEASKPSASQKFLEKIFNNDFGKNLNRKLGQWQLKRIKTGEYVVADNTELAFHSLERKKALLGRFFKFEQQDNREAEKAEV